MVNLLLNCFRGLVIDVLAPVLLKCLVAFFVEFDSLGEVIVELAVTYEIKQRIDIALSNCLEVDVYEVEGVVDGR